MNTDELIQETSRSYRGATEITLKWEENGQFCSAEFSDENETQTFKSQLLARLTADQAPVEPEADHALSDRLNAMGIEIEDAVSIIENLMLVAPEGFDYWIDSLKSHRATRELCTLKQIEDVDVALNGYSELLKESGASGPQLLNDHKRLELLASKLKPEGVELEQLVGDFCEHRIGGVSFKEMSDIYRKYCEAKLKSSEIFKEYRARLEKQESDEDERYYIISKLKKMISSFEGDILNSSIDQAREWIISQPGSGSAKERLTEIVEDFYEYLEEDNANIIRKNFVA